MAKIKVEVDGIDRTMRSIERDLHRGMEKSVDTLISNAKDRAREVIRQEDAIFNAEVYKGFRQAETGNNPTSVSGKLYNTVEHAAALEEGADYGSEGPPVEALLPWVVRKMSVSADYDLDSDSGGDDDSGGKDSGGSQQPQIGITNLTSYETYEVPESYLTVEDDEQLGFDEVFNGQDVFVYYSRGGEVKSGSVIFRNFSAQYINVDVDGSAETIYPERNDGVRLVSGENFSTIDDSRKESILREHLDGIKFDSGIEESISEIKENISDGLFSNSNDYDLLKRTVDGVFSFNKYSGDYAASASPTVSHGRKGSKLNYKNSNKRKTHIHEFIHATHQVGGWDGKRYPDGIPDWSFNKFGEPKDADEHESYSNYMLSNSDGYTPSEDSALERIQDRYYSEISQYTTSVTQEQIFSSSEINADVGDILKIETASGNTVEIQLNSTEYGSKKHYSDGEIYKTIQGESLDGSNTVIYMEDGEMKGDVRLLGISYLENLQTKTQVEQAFRENVYTGDSVEYDSVSKSDLYGEDSTIADIGDVINFTQEGEEFHGRVVSYESTEKVDFRIEMEVMGEKFNRYLSWYDGGLTSSEVHGIFKPKFSKTPTLEEDTDLKRLYEAVNIAWVEQVFQVSISEDSSGLVSREDINYVGSRRYASRAANETLTTVSEILTTDGTKWNKSHVKSTYQSRPWLVEAWSKVHPLSNTAIDALGELGVEVNEDGTLRSR